MDENPSKYQSNIALLPDINEAEHLGRDDVECENNHENGDQVNRDTRKREKVKHTIK